jgi:hypothetical protein
MYRLEEFSDYYYSDESTIQINPYVDYSQLRFATAESVVTYVNPLDIHLPMEQEITQAVDEFIQSDSTKKSSPRQKRKDPRKKYSVEVGRVTKKRLGLRCKCPDTCSACNKK